MIPVAFIQTVLGIDPSRLNRRRNRRLGRAVANYVDADLRDRTGVRLADALCMAHGMKRLPISIPSVRSEFRIVRSASSGTVRDVRLRRLARLAGKSRGQKRAYLIARIGVRLRAGDPIAVLPTIRREKPRRERQIVRLQRGDRDDVLSSLIAELHEDATAAIHEQQLAPFERTALEYRELLLAFPKSWSGHNIRYTEELTAGVGLDLGIFSRIDPLMGDEMREVMHTGNVRMANVLTSLAFRVAADAVPLGARGLFRQMFRLLAAGYAIAANVEDKTSSLSMSNDCLGKVFELVRLVVIPQVQGEASAQLPWDQAGLLLVASFEEIGELLRQAVDSGLPQRVSDVDDRWSDVMSMWRPDLEGPIEALVEVQALHHGERQPAVEAARREIDAAKLQTELLNLLRQQRSTFRFELAAWQLRRMRDGAFSGHGQESVEAFRLLARHFTDTAQLQSAVNDALKALFSPGGGHFQRWVLSEAAAASLGYGARPSPNSEGGLVACFLVLLIMAAHPDAGVPLVDVDEWLVSRADSLRAELDSLVGEVGLWEGLDVNRVSDRVALLRAALDDAYSTRRKDEEERIAAEAPDPEIVATTAEQVRSSWKANRIAPALFRAFSSVVVDEQPPPAGSEHFLVRATVPKSAFVAGNYANDVFLNSELGRAAANSEMPVLISKLADGAELSSPAWPRVEVVRHAVRAMREEGYEPTVLIVAIDWLLGEELGLHSSERIDPPFELPEATRHWYKGVFEGVHVIAWPRVLKGQALVVDLQRYGRWRQWTPQGEEELSVLVEFVDEEEALRLAEADPTLGADPNHQTVEERALRLQSEAVVRILERWTIETTDPLAARKISVPEVDAEQ
jgi:hypothetical protein